MSEKMTREDIIRMAREAGDDVDHTLPSDLDFLERFAHKVIEHFLATTGQYVTNDASREAAIRAAVEAEREACAKLCESEWSTEDERKAGQIFAREIRALNKTGKGHES